MKKLLGIIALLLGFLILGAGSFRLTEGWDWGDENLVLTADCVLPGFVAHRPVPDP